MKRILLILSLYFLASLSSEGNTPVRFTHYSTLNGLPNDFILSIVQDNNGFLWFGTHLGIVRFDGHSFNLFQPNPKKSNSLSYKHLSKMYIDLHGNLWATFTEVALNRMDTQTGKFYNYLADTTQQGSISSLLITSFFEDQDSTLWVATHTGLNIYNNEEDNFVSVLPEKLTKNTFPSNYIYSLTDDTLGNIWLFSSKGIGRIRKKDFNLKSLGEIVHRKEIDQMEITSMKSDHKFKLWFTTLNNGVFCFDIAKGQLYNYLKDVQRISSIYIDRHDNVYVFSDVGNTLYYYDNKENSQVSFSAYPLFETTEQVLFLRFTEDKTGNIWISSSYGLDMFSHKNGVIHYKNDPLKEQSLTTNTIFLTFVDHTNNLWVSNYRRGLDKADLNQKPFRQWFTNPNLSDNIFSGTNITGVLEDSRNYLWVGESGNSLMRIDKVTNQFVPVQVKEHQVNFSAIFEDSKGDIWVGSYDQGIERISSKTLEVTYSNNKCVWENNRYTFWGVRKFVEDKEGDIWFASATGVQKWIRETGQIFPYSRVYDKHTPDQGFYRTVIIDSEGILWSGSYNGGLARYNTKKNTVKRFTHIPGDKNSISGNGVYVIYEESDSTFLIGTTFGLNRFNKKTEHFSLVNTKRSLYNHSIYTIIPDSLDNYWMATDNGLVCLNKKTLECIFYYEADGLPANEFNTTASCISSDGNIYIGSPKGLLSFNPNDFTKNPYNAHPLITDLQINNTTISPGDTLNGRVVLTRQIWATDILELKYFENDFTFQFSAMHYAVPENNKFWYMLEGYKDEWIATGTNKRWASFTGLAPGNYKFRLKASNNDGVICKSEDEVSIEINITPPFWKTTWFKIAVIFLVAAIIGIFIRLRILRFKRLNILLERKVDKRTKELKDLNISLREQQEEIHSQKESLVITNEMLKRTQEEIIAQNKELDLHRNKLESLVEERTSDLLKALNEAEESDRLKSSFLANMSHEIRTPMNAIVGFSSLLQDDDVDKGAKERYIEAIIKNSQSLLVLINDILDLSKIQSNQLTFSAQQNSIKDILNETYQIFSILDPNKKIELKLNTELIKDDLIIITDKYRFKQVISNLLSNALKFTKEGFVEFGVFDVKDQLTIYVKDTGIGIPKKTGDAIFERFLKLEEDVNILYRGVGLGLAISRSLVELWGGNLWYESIVNKGTTFYFTHPLNLQSSIKIKEKKVKSKPLPDLRNVNILIAEDEQSNYNLLLAYLNKKGANIFWAKNGAEACNIAKLNSIDLILMDIKMPVMGGIEAAKYIKQNHAEIPIIAQSAYTHTNQQELLREKIFDRFISKPISRLELFNAIADLI